MYNPRNENELELGRFGEYLLRTRIATERHAPYGRNRPAGWSIPFAFAPHLRSEADHGAGLRQTATEEGEGRGFRKEEEAGVRRETCFVHFIVHWDRSKCTIRCTRQVGDGRCCNFVASFVAHASPKLPSEGGSFVDAAVSAAIGAGATAGESGIGGGNCSQGGWAFNGPFWAIAGILPEAVRLRRKAGSTGPTNRS